VADIPIVDASYNGNVTSKLTVDKLGRLVLPKPMGEKLQLVAGDQLEMESSDDRITLRPLRGTAQLRKKRGVWVLQSGERSRLRWFRKPWNRFGASAIKGVCDPAVGRGRLRL
jgi:AbrB family looped-hinge helix DNA binding protein